MTTWKFNRKKIRQLREQSNLSLADFGKRVGRPRQAVQMWEEGITAPNLESLLKMCAAFDVPPSFFFFEVTTTVGNKKSRVKEVRQ